MSKREFLDKLRKALENDLSGSVVQENVNYYNTYINEEVQKGRSEREVLDELGDPWAIAKNIVTSEEIKGNTQETYESYEPRRQQRSQEYEQGCGEESGYSGNPHSGAGYMVEKIIAHTGNCGNCYIDCCSDRRNHQYSCTDFYSASVCMRSNKTDYKFQAVSAEGMRMYS